jgi:alkaline phosphatase
MKYKYLHIAIAVFVLFQTNALSYAQKNAKQPEVKKVILLIGDGMGLSQVYAAYTVNQCFLNIFSMPFIGLSKTNSIDNYITDSAAGGTALSTGSKTKNGYLAVDSAGNPLETILEQSERNGLRTGLVSTSAITHATPASFIAHVAGRENYEEIATYFLKTDIDVFVGGGINHFAKRADGRNLVKELQQKGYYVGYSLTNSDTIKSEKVAILTAPEHNPKMSEGRGNMLTDATKLAIKTLDKNNKKGFFLMVEGSQIDWGGHNNDAQYITNEVIDFDKTVGYVLEYARQNPGTLVIVTADHETGGLTLIDGNLSKNTFTPAFSTTHHSATPVPVYAYGPGAELFTGFYENITIHDKIYKLLGLHK